MFCEIGHMGGASGFCGLNNTGSNTTLGIHSNSVSLTFLVGKL